MTMSSPNLSSGSSSSERENTAQNWHQASLAIEAAYSRITQVRQDIIRLSNTMPDALSSPTSQRDVDPGHNALLLTATERREPLTGGQTTIATDELGYSFNPYLSRASGRFESEFSSNNTYENTESAGSRPASTNDASSSHPSTMQNFLPPQRHLASNSFSLQSPSSTTRGREVASRDYTIRRDAERFSYYVENPSNSVLATATSVDLNNANVLSPQRDAEMQFHDTAQPLPRPTTSSAFPTEAGGLSENRWRSFAADLQARRFAQAHTSTSDFVLQQNLALNALAWRGQDPSSLQELETYSNWRDQDFPLWLPNEDREWGFANGHPLAESTQMRREPVRTSQRNNTTESRPINVSVRRTDPPRRGWARLDSDGIEIPQNEEEELERTRTEYRMRALQRAREERATGTYVDAPGGGSYRAPVIYGSVMDAALHVQSSQRRQPSSYEKQDDCHPHAPFYVDPLPMPLASMEINPARVDDLYVDIVLPQRACFAGR